MEYRKLGKTGIKVSEIGLGTVEFGGRVNEQISLAIIHQAMEMGINFIDTADVYCQGRSEELVGKAVKGRRSDVLIASKFGIPTGKGPNKGGGSRYHMIEAIEASLKRLGTDYVDLYYIHWPDPTTPVEETLQAMDDLVHAGKVRYIACSNFSGWMLCNAQWISKVEHLESFIAVQTRYNLLDRQIENDLVPCCQAFGISVIPWSPLADGFLTGKYHRGEKAPAETRLGGPRPTFLPPILTDENFDKLDKLVEFSVEHGHSVGELAIAWLLSHPWLGSVIAGATKVEQLSANAAAANWKLTAEDITQLETII